MITSHKLLSFALAALFVSLLVVAGSAYADEDDEDEGGEGEGETDIARIVDVRIRL